MHTTSSLNIDILTSRMLIGLAHWIESIENISLLPLASTHVKSNQLEYNEIDTDFEFTLMTGGIDSFNMIIIGGNIKVNEDSCDLTERNSIRRAMRHIAESFMPPNSVVVAFEVRVEVGVIINAWLRWRTSHCKSEHGEIIHNQITDPSKVKTTWNNLRFRSHSEKRIAVALDQSGVLFLPNCLGRLSVPSGRRNLECDFLVCCEGKWGILEVDGEPYHPASRAAQDHDRDRLFKAHGIRVVERFDAKECFENAKGVVQSFLEILRKL